jgi:hypothetical protein
VSWREPGCYTCEAPGSQRSRFGTLAGWPFATYVLLTIGGLALLAIGLLSGNIPGWLGWLTLGADVVLLAGYLWFKDIPPFVFYLLLLVVGLVVV